MLFFDLSFIPTFFFWGGIVIFLNILGFCKKKSIWNGLNLVISLILLIIHLRLKETLPNWNFSIICDFVFLAISIGLFLYVNDIEVRRKVISEVFENKYKGS